MIERTPVVNLSTVYADLPRDERPAAAAADGSRLVESWWDFESATPDPTELAGFLQAIRDAGTRLTAINTYSGDRAAGECGLACLPDRVEEFRASVLAVAEVARTTGATQTNVAIGPLLPTRWTAEEQWETAARNYAWAAGKLAAVGVTVLLEPLIFGDNGYPFHTGHDVAEFLDQRLPEVSNIGILFDAFHLAANQLDPAKVFRELAPRIKHVQLADFPGRGAPGTGGLDFEGLLAAIAATTYDGEIALEYFNQTN